MYGCMKETGLNIFVHACMCSTMCINSELTTPTPEQSVARLPPGVEARALPFGTLVFLGDWSKDLFVSTREKEPTPEWMDRSGKDRRVL